jgi:hypothetical protein
MKHPAVEKLARFLLTGVMLFMTGFNILDTPPTPPLEPTRIPTPEGQEDIIAINPGGEMKNNATYAPSFTIDHPFQITLILTIHWNGGKGAEPGTISLEDSEGNVYGPWQARGAAYKDVPNVRWIVEPMVMIPAGEYTVYDSEPETWTNNEASNLTGFTRVAGYRMGEVAGAHADPVEESAPPSASEPEQPVEEAVPPSVDEPVQTVGESAPSSVGIPEETVEEPPDASLPAMPVDNLPFLPEGKKPDQPPLPMTLVSQTAFNADNQLYQDKAGVYASAPVGTVPQGSSLKLVASQPAEEVDRSLEQTGIKRISSFYKVDVNGDGDSLPDAVISFPSSSPNDRIVELIEGNGLIMADDALVNGRREVHVTISAGNIYAPQYALMNFTNGITTTSYEVPARNKASGGRQADLIPAEDWPVPKLEDCHVIGSLSSQYSGRVYFRELSCLRDKAYHIDAVSSDILKEEDWNNKKDRIAKIIEQVRLARIKYHEMNFTGALLKKDGSSRTVMVRLQTGKESPKYSSISSSINLGWDFLETDLTPKLKQSIAHEVFHWVEHASYSMNNFVSMDNDMRWWLDISCELATFLIDPKNIQIELLDYGQQGNKGAGNILTFQEPILEWYRHAEDSRYLQAVQYYLLMSEKSGTGDVSCLPDSTSFVKLINDGKVGIAEEKNRSIFIGGNWTYAQYLLNQLPEKMCRPVPTGGILEKAVGYGDWLHASGFKPTGGVYYGMDSISTNIQKKETGIATISAPMAPGALYPIRFSNGAELPYVDLQNKGGWAKPSVPYELVIYPSVPYFYSIGNGPKLWNDGTKELRISPITSEKKATIYEKDAGGNVVKVEKAGIPLVRVVAINNTKSEATFKAVFKPVGPYLFPNPTNLNNLSQKPDQKLAARLEGLPPTITEPVVFKFSQVLADGSPKEFASLEKKPEDGKAEVEFQWNFTDPTIKEVLVEALYKAGKDGNQTGEVKGKIPVKAAPANSFVDVILTALTIPYTTTVFSVAEYRCPVHWTSISSFETDISQGQCTKQYTGEAAFPKDGISITGQIGQGVVDIQVSDPLIDPVGQVNSDVDCPISFNLKGIPISPTGSKTPGMDLYKYHGNSDGAGDALQHISNFSVILFNQYIGNVMCTGDPSNLSFDVKVLAPATR